MTDAIFRLAWAHDFNTDRNIAATFQTRPSLVVNGAAQADDAAALTTASAEMKWLNGFSVAATFGFGIIPATHPDETDEAVIWPEPVSLILKHHRNISR